MKKLLVPLFLALFGVGAGGAAGVVLKPADSIEAENCITPSDAPEVTAIEPDSEMEYIKLNNQFVVPVIREGRVRSLVVMSLSVEAVLGTREDLYKREPKLRDELLQVMFNHANLGGFDGSFTNGPQMDALRHKLLVAAQNILGDVATDVLIVDIARQDG